MVVYFQEKKCLAFTVTVSIVIHFTGINIISAEQCTKIKKPGGRGNDCTCLTPSGFELDLSKVPSSNSNWKSGKPIYLDESTTQASDINTYSFDPCVPFTEGDPSSPCNGVTVCQKTTEGVYYNLGNIQSLTFYGELSKPGFHALYEPSTQLTTKRYTHVYIKCGSKESHEIIGEDPNAKGNYSISITTNAACNKSSSSEMMGHVRSHPLSAGSVLLILFFVFVAIYLIGGMLVLRFVRGARGVEMIPHYAFWSDFPLLVKDGVMFIAHGCKTQNDQAYDQI